MSAPTIRVNVTKGNYRQMMGVIARRESTGPRMEDFLDEVGKVLIAYLKSYSKGERKPDGRPTHPGHWGDVTYELRDSYEYEVVDGKLWLANTSGHAAYVEAMDGYFVLSGVGDSEEFAYALRAGLRKVYPRARVKDGPASGSGRARKA